MVISRGTTSNVFVEDACAAAGTAYSFIGSMACQEGSLSGFMTFDVPKSVSAGLSDAERVEYAEFLADDVLLRYIHDTTHTSFLDPESILAQSIVAGGYADKIPSGRGGKFPAPFAVPISMPGYRGRLSVSVLCGYLRECEERIRGLLECVPASRMRSFPLYSLTSKYSCSYTRLCRLLHRAHEDISYSDRLFGLFNERVLGARKLGNEFQEAALCDPRGFGSSESTVSLRSAAYMLNGSVVAGCKAAMDFSNTVRSSLNLPFRTSEVAPAKSFTYSVDGTRKRRVMTLPVELPYSLRIWSDFQSELRAYFLGPLLEEYPLEVYDVDTVNLPVGELGLKEGTGVSYRVLGCLTLETGRIEITYESLLKAYEILRSVNYSRLCEVEALLLFLGGMSLFWAWSPFVQKNVAHCANEVERINPVFSPSLKSFGDLVSARGITGSASGLSSGVLRGSFRSLAPWVFLPESLIGIRLSLRSEGSSVERLRTSAHAFSGLLNWIRVGAQSVPVGLFPYFVTEDSVCLAYHPDYLGSAFSASDPESVLSVLCKHLPDAVVHSRDFSAECITTLAPSLGVLFPFLGSTAVSHLSTLHTDSTAVSPVGSTLYLKLRRDEGQFDYLWLTPMSGIMKPRRRPTVFSKRYSNSGLFEAIPQFFNSWAFEAGRRVVSLWCPTESLDAPFTSVKVYVGSKVSRFDCFISSSGVLLAVVRSDFEVGSVYYVNGSARVVSVGSPVFLDAADFPKGLCGALKLAVGRLLKLFPVSDTEVLFTAYSPKDAYCRASGCALGELDGLPDWVPL